MKQIFTYFSRELLFLGRPGNMCNLTRPLSEMRVECGWERKKHVVKKIPSYKKLGLKGL